jgi:Family of unknown function (DUF6270)
VDPVDRGRSVAIWGSCVTRDAFALADRADELAQHLPLVYYGARSSWVSQDSRPWTGREPDLQAMTSGFGRRMVTEDLSKTVVDRLVEHRPDIVVLDLVDERLPIARIGHTWITVSDYLKQTDLAEHVLAEASELVSMTKARRAHLFATAARHLVRRLVRELPDTVFVLNEAPYTTRVGDGTEMEEPKAGWARELEAAQQPLIRSLVREFGPRLVRATPPAEVCLADPDHRWGVTSYHYVADYYHWLIDLLLTVETVPLEQRSGRSGRTLRAATRRPARPSAGSRMRSLLGR